MADSAFAFADILIYIDVDQMVINLKREREREIGSTLLSSSGPLTHMKFALDSFATAFAKSVLPHPGGPQSSTPQAASIPTALNSSGLRIGCTIAIWSSSLVP